MPPPGIAGAFSSCGFSTTTASVVSSRPAMDAAFCSALRTTLFAAHLTDHVLPHLPVRQGVLSLPKRLRPHLHHRPDVAGAVLQIFIRGLRSTLRKTSPTTPRSAELAAISFPQRFGSSLNPHYHFHVLALDGVLSEAESASGEAMSGQLRFHEATLLTPEHWLHLERAVQRRVLRAFKRRGLLDEDAAADMLTWQASGGFSVDASVRVEGEDRAGVERLVRYCARGPLALQRIHALDGQEALVSPDARLLYQLPEPDLQGRTELLLSPLELLERLARLIPPPRIHRHRYHGLLAPHARLRAAVVAIGSGAVATSEAAARSAAESTQAAAASDPKRPSPSRFAWAQLLAPIFEVLPLLCPACGGEMRIVAFLADPPVVKAILLHLGLPHRPPQLTPARGPPQAELAFDQSSGFGPTHVEPGPDVDFDQSPPDAWDD